MHVRTLYMHVCTLCMHVCAGTFAVVELMIGNSVDRVLSSDSGVMSNCLDIGTGNDSMVMADDLMGLTGMNGSDVIFEFYGQNTTCSDVRLDVVVTLAMLSGLIMVCVCMIVRVYL